jgi:hypothetical protein
MRSLQKRSGAGEVKGEWDWLIASSSGCNHWNPLIHVEPTQQKGQDGICRDATLPGAYELRDAFFDFDFNVEEQAGNSHGHHQRRSIRVQIVD